MINHLSDLKDYAIHTENGFLGAIQDFYFDDQTWDVRYAVVRLDAALGERDVLLSSAIFTHIRPVDRVIESRVDLDRVRSSPEIDLTQPISREVESGLSEHYLWPEYWIPATGFGLGVGDLSAVPMVDLQADLQEQQERQQDDNQPDQHLYSTEGIRGFHILTNQEDDIGVVDDFLMDDEDWRIDYIVAAVGNWNDDRKTLLSPEWVAHYSRAQSLVFVDLDTAAVESAPDFDGDLDENTAHALYRHYGREETRDYPDET